MRPQYKTKYIQEMKKILFALSLLMAGNFAMQAQDYAQSRKDWDGTPVDLKQFRGRLASDTTIIELAWIMDASLTKEKIGDTKYIYYRFHPTLDLSESAVKPGFINEQTQDLAQTMFDLLELYGRKATQEVINSQPNDIYDVVRYYNNQVKHRMDDVSYITHMGQNAEQMDLQSTAVTLELEECKIDPTRVELKEPTFVADMAIGFSVVAPFTSYLSGPAYGLNYSLGMGNRRHLYSMDATFGFGAECKEDIQTDNGTIEKGESVNLLNMMLTYGYRLGEYRGRACYPTVGFGMNSVIGPQFERSDGKRDNFEVSGVTFAIGLTYDLPFARTIYAGTSVNESGMFAGRSEYDAKSIRLKTYLAWSKAGDDIGWYPSLNLSVLFDINGIRFK